jgi:hypothetical protein
VRGVAVDVSPAWSSHVVCYCDDCQAYARFLGTPGIMDDHGGTDVFQVPPARVRITEGLDALESMRLSKKGLLRWYAGCCRTPVGNTVNARVPFIGVIHSFRSREDDVGRRPDVLAEPVGIWGRYAIGGAPPGVETTTSFSLVARFAANLLRWKFSGQGSPSPLFDEKTGAPRAKPKVLTPTEREALR